MKSLAIVAFVALPAAAVQASDLKDIVTTCSALALEKASVSAECTAENGAKYKTALRLRGVNNHNGALAFDNDSSTMSAFHTSCTQLSIDSRGRLAGVCKDDNGDRFWSSLDLRPVLKNYNGTLVYPLD